MSKVIVSLLNCSIAIALMLTAFASPTFAADIEIECNPDTGDDCVMTPELGAPLFNETNLLPGDNIERIFTVSNQSDEHTCELVMNFDNIQDQQNLLTQFLGTIFPTGQSGSPIIGPTSFLDLLGSTDVELGEIAPESTLDFTWTAHFLNTAGNQFQNTQGSFDFSVNFACLDDNGGNTGPIIDGNAPGSENTITITKTTTTEVIQSNTTNNVTYIIIVQNTGNNTIMGNTVVDLPPSKFNYLPSSWTAFSSRRGDLKSLGITTEPNYSSPGTWNLGELEPGEEVTLTYQAETDSDIQAGIYPDLAYAYGIDPESETLVFANQEQERFVGAQVAVGGPGPAEVSYDVQDNPGQVLGAIDQLPETGVHVSLLLLGLALTLTGGGGLYYVSRRSHDI